MKEAMIATKGYNFDDVLLVPQKSDIASRSEVDLGTVLDAKRAFELLSPIISANMDTVTEINMAVAMYDLGGIGILHRYAEQEEIEQWIKYLKAQLVPAVPSIGIQGRVDFDKAKAYVKAGARAICVDVAHAHNEHVLSFVKILREGLPNTTLIVGNVATRSGAYELACAGADVIKTGVGPGSFCSTRYITGHGVPQLTAIEQCVSIKTRFPAGTKKIIADGGIKNSGDIVKALAIGADAVMVGSLLAGTDQTPGDVFDIKGQKHKVYRGMSSRSAQLDFRGKVNNDAPEGIEKEIPFKGSVYPIVKELLGGIRSGLSYSGAKNISELQQNAEWMEVTSIK